MAQERSSCFSRAASGRFEISMSSRKSSINNASQPVRTPCGAASSSLARDVRAGHVEHSRVRWWPAVLAALFCGFVAESAAAQEPAPVQEPAAAQQAATPAQPVGVEACLAAHLAGQELRQSSKLLESREQFRMCARQECPGAIARDCVEWLGQYERRIPSITLRVTADGAARSGARVLLDGVPVENLNGKAFELNPGAHVVRVELAPFAPFETSLLISEGDQFRVVEAAFASPASSSSSSEPLTAAPEAVVMERPVPTLSYVFGVVTLAAAANGAGWAMSSWNLRQELDGCAPFCNPKGVEVLKQRAMIADISWGVSVASLVATVAFYALRPEVPAEAERPIAFGLDVLPGGAVGSVSVSAF